MTSGAEYGHRHKRDFLLRNAAALVSTSVVTAGLGFIYWTVAARMYAVADVGESTTAISAMSLIAPFTVLGFGTALISRLPTMQSGRAQLVSTAVVVCALAAFLVSLACALLLPASYLGLPGIGESIWPTMLFAGGIVAHSVGLLLDNALLSATGGGIQLRRNTIFASVKLVLLVIFALTLNRYGSLGIYASWFLAGLLSILVVGIKLVRDHGLSPGDLLPRLSALDGLHFHAVKHHMLNLSLSVPYYMMPIVANVILGSEQAGYLYATWSLAGFVFMLPMAMSISLFASGAKDSSTILRELRFTLRLSMAACTAANLIILPMGGLLLQVFGPAYAENGRDLLIVLCLGGFGVIIRDHHVAVARIAGRVGREGALMIALGAGEIIAAAIGAHRGGLLGLGLGWLVAIAVEVLVCTPLVWRAYRGHLTIADSAAAAGEPARPDDRPVGMT
jgi:O-antigen/teichoic acid export membrane protein